MQARSLIQRLAIAVATLGVLAVAAVLTTSSSAQLPFYSYSLYPGPDAGPGADPVPTLDRTGPALPRHGATATAALSKTGTFTFVLGPFKENVSGTVGFDTTGAMAAARGSKLRLGKKRLKAAPGEKARVKVKLSGRDQRALRLIKRLHVRAAATVSDENHNVSRRSYTFVLRGARHK